MKTLDPVLIISYTLIFNMLSMLFLPNFVPLSMHLTPTFLPASSFDQGYEMAGATVAFVGLFITPFLMAFFIMFLIDACRKELSPETRALGIRILEYLFRSLAVLFAVGLALLSVFVIVRSQVR